MSELARSVVRLPQQTIASMIGSADTHAMRMATVIIAAVAVMPWQDRARSRWCTTRPDSIAADGERDQYQ